MTDRETSNAKNAESAVAALRQLAREEISRGGVADRVLVEAVSGNAIKVRALGSAVPGAQLIPISGFVPAVGSEVLLVRTFGGQLVAMPLTSVALGTAAGQIPTAAQVQNNLGMQRSILFRDMGSDIISNPAAVDFREGMVAQVASSGYLSVLVDYGGYGGQAGVSSQVARSDHTHPFVPPSLSSIGRTTSSTVSSTSFSAQTNTSDSISVEPNTLYDITMNYLYNTFPGTSGVLQGQTFIGGVNGSVLDASSNVRQALGGGQSFGGFNTGNATTLNWGVRFRANGGSHALYGGYMQIIATPRRSG